ncbi:UNVERIFIED_CONTAM: hypothetical protein NCL1_10588 [Trichonephila clavipes]
MIHIGMTAQGRPWASQEAFSRPAFILPVINPSEMWPTLSSCADWLSIEDFFSGAVFVHSDNVTCPFNSLHFRRIMRTPIFTKKPEVN